MLHFMMKSKIHRATVTDTNIGYEGSLTVDSVLMKLAGMQPYERVQVVVIDNGNRFETYLIEGKPNSGEMCLNGGAAHLGKIGDKLIVITYALMTDEERKNYKPRVILVDSKNRPVQKK